MQNHLVFSVKVVRRMSLQLASTKSPPRAKYAFLPGQERKSYFFDDHRRVYYVEFNSGDCIPHNLIDGHQKSTICVPAQVRMHILRAAATLQTHACRTCGGQLLLKNQVILHNLPPRRCSISSS